MKGFAGLIGLTLIVFAVQAGGSADDLTAMQGQWSVALTEMSGKPTGAEFTKVKMVFLVAGDEYRMLADDRPIAGGKLKLDARRTPHTIDATITEGPNRGMMQTGIYEIKGDEMIAAFAAPGGTRPTEFKTKEGSGQSLVRYARIKK